MYAQSDVIGAGKTGIGLGKRAASPTAPERRAKMARMAEDHEHRDFRDRARDEYVERRAEKQLGPTQRTCATLDEKAGREVRLASLFSPSFVCPASSHPPHLCSRVRPYHPRRLFCWLFLMLAFRALLTRGAVQRAVAGPFEPRDVPRGSP